MEFHVPEGQTDAQISAYMRTLSNRKRKQYITLLWQCWIERKWRGHALRRGEIPLFLIPFMRQPIQKKYFMEGHLIKLTDYIRDYMGKCYHSWCGEHGTCRSCAIKECLYNYIGADWSTNRVGYRDAIPLITDELEKLWAGRLAVPFAMALDRLELVPDLVNEVIQPLVSTSEPEQVYRTILHKMLDKIKAEPTSLNYVSSEVAAMYDAMDDAPDWDEDDRRYF